MSVTKNWHIFSHNIRNEGMVIGLYVLTILVMYIKVKEKHVDTRKRLDLQVLLPPSACGLTYLFHPKF